MTMTQQDVIVMGGGMVGAATALGLSFAFFSKERIVFTPLPFVSANFKSYKTAAIN
ncbi:hypothetical protein KZ327_01870, partial [Glaesserella parasuis]|nr:hypothetical protein [Glaesserella parasuis]